MNYKKHIRVVATSRDPWVYKAINTLTGKTILYGRDRKEVYAEAKKLLMREDAEMKRRAGYNPRSKKARYSHSRLKSKSRFDKRSFRTIQIGRHGRLLRVACSKGKWRNGRCSVGMQGQGILTPKKYAKLLRLTRSRRIAANGRRRRN